MKLKKKNKNWKRSKKIKISHRLSKAVVVVTIKGAKTTMNRTNSIINFKTQL